MSLVGAPGHEALTEWNPLAGASWALFLFPWILFRAWLQGPCSRGRALFPGRCSGLKSRNQGLNKDHLIQSLFHWEAKSMAEPVLRYEASRRLGQEKPASGQCP